MGKRNNWLEFQVILDQHHIKKLYHFTDRENLQSIINNNGLYSWADCEEKGIIIVKPGGGEPSRKLDKKHGLQNYVRLSFTKRHPMMYVAKEDGRINDPVILEINPEILYEEDTLFSDKNAASNDAHVGGTLDDFKKIHFKSVQARRHFDLEESERPYFQAEVLVKNFVPLSYIINIHDFGIPIELSIPDEEELTTKVYQEDFENGVKDEYGAIYSPDGKRLLQGPESVESYTIKKGTLVIADNAFRSHHKLMKITFPDSLTLIGDRAFRVCGLLQTISLPQGLIHIGDEAFGDCKSLQTISLPQGLEHIGDGAFCWCESLQSVTLPQSLKHIGKNPISGCRSLSEVTSLSPHIIVQGHGIYDRDKKELNAYFGDEMYVTVPQWVTRIGDYAFAWHQNLKFISLPQGLTHIGDWAFAQCWSLEYVSFPLGVTHIGERAFIECKSMHSLDLPDGLSHIGFGAFKWCKSLQSISWPDSLTHISEEAFLGCGALQSIILPECMTYIGSGAFASCSSLSYCYLPQHLEHIGHGTFSDCFKLNSVKTPPDTFPYYERLFSENHVFNEYFDDFP